MKSKKAFKVFWDTEDNSREINLGEMSLAEVKKKRKVTLICALDDDGGKFIGKGPDAIPRFLCWLQDLATRHDGLIAYAFNLQYDLGNLFFGCIDEVQPTLFGGKLLKAEYGLNIVFKDFANLWPGSVARIGSAMDLPKLSFDANDADYCLRDCEILQAAYHKIEAMAARYGVTKIPTTMATLTTSMFLKGVNEFWECNDEWFRQGYYGGRCEIFESGIGERNCGIRYTDINSLYPSVMLKPYPGENLKVIPKGKTLPLYGMADVTIEIPKGKIGLLPVKTQTGNAYPTGKLRGIWCICEIWEAMQWGARLIAVHGGKGTDEIVFPFKSYISEIYSARLKASSKAEKELLKLFMNSLYGHLALGGEGMTVGYRQDSAEFQAFAEAAADSPEPIFVETYGERVLLPVQLPAPKTNNILHAAYVTAYARIAILRFMKLVEKDLLYCDTDSVFFASNEAQFPESDMELGAMKLEKQLTAEQAKTARFIVPKTYTYKIVDDWFVKAKGVYQRRDAKTGKQTPESAKKTKEFIENGQTTELQPYKLKESIGAFDSDNAKPLSFWRPVTKKMHGGVEGNEHYRTVKNYANGLWTPKDFSELSLPDVDE